MQLQQHPIVPKERSHATIDRSPFASTLPLSLTDPEFSEKKTSLTSEKSDQRERKNEPGQHFVSPGPVIPGTPGRALPLFVCRFVAREGSSIKAAPMTRSCKSAPARVYLGELCEITAQGLRLGGKNLEGLFCIDSHVGSVHFGKEYGECGYYCVFFSEG